MAVKTVCKHESEEFNNSKWSNDYGASMQILPQSARLLLSVHFPDWAGCLNFKP